MRSTKRVLVIVTALAAMVPLGATAAGEPIRPRTPLRDGICQSGEFCVYRDSNRSGPVLDWNRAGDDNAYSNNTWPIVGGNVNDEASSYWNRTTCAVRVYRNSNQNPPGQTFPAGSFGNFSGTSVGNDQASSHDACV
jgi:hypothetical protein